MSRPNLRRISHLSPEWIYRLQHPFAFFFALGIFFAGLAMLVITPKDLGLDAAGLNGTVQFLWHLSYTLGGLIFAAGLWRNNPRMEAVGLITLAGPFAAVSYLSFANADLQGGVEQILPGALFLIFITLGCLARFLTLLVYFPSGEDDSHHHKIGHDPL